MPPLPRVESQPSEPSPATLPSWAIGPFHRPPDAKPVLRPNAHSLFDCPMRGRPVRWEALHAFNPAAIVRNGKIFVLYRAEDDTGDMAIGLHTSRLGLASSEDGVHFDTLPQPVLYPDEDDQKQTEWDGGCEDPRLVEAADGRYVLTYTQWDRETPRLSIATSSDLLKWKKHGPAFARVHGSKYHSIESKAGGVVTSLQDGRLKAAMIDGKYWMYWGEWEIRLAWSDDLIDWNVVEDSDGQPLVVMGPDAGTFDSPLVEPGPPPILTERGILLLYNGKNDGDHHVAGLNAFAYSAGQALFDAAAPAKLISRLSTPFLKPELAWERSGQYGAGTTFIEGLAFFNDQWFLYYGCADSLVGVAIHDAT